MDEKILMEYMDHAGDVMKVMSTRGILLAAWKDKDKQIANAMTIGWGLIGSIWSRPIWQVMVRPSRFTFELLERENHFSVNVLPVSRQAAVQLCGTKSGRDCDKLAEAGLTVSPGDNRGTPLIDQSVISYECHVVHKNDFVPEQMVPDIREGNYPSGDFHRVYWGQVITAHVDKAKLADLF